MRVRDVTTAQRRMLEGLVTRISPKLEAVFADATDATGPNVGVVLRERGSSVTIEVPLALIDEAEDDARAREALRVRVKGRRDRMLFRAPPAPLQKNIQPAMSMQMFGPPSGGRRPMRGRR